jgi:ElaB/YqjD/DUF883 family membrane-anchored ribosome-binding protein
MATAISAKEVGHSASALCARPAFDAIEDNVRKARRAVLHGRHATEDFATEAALTVRRHPFTAVGAAVMAGLVVSCVAGFSYGQRGR